MIKKLNVQDLPLNKPENSQNQEDMGRRGREHTPHHRRGFSLQMQETLSKGALPITGPKHETTGKSYRHKSSPLCHLRIMSRHGSRLFFKVLTIRCVLKSSGIKM